MGKEKPNIPSAHYDNISRTYLQGNPIAKSLITAESVCWQVINIEKTFCLCVLCESSAHFAVRFNRKERKELRKGHKEVKFVK